MCSTRLKIRKTALVAFANKGYKGTTIKEISKKVGITPPSVYKHYSSKDKLFLDVMDYCVGEYEEYFCKFFDTLRSNCKKEVLFLLFKEEIKFFINNQNISRFISNNMRISTKGYNELIHKKLEKTWKNRRQLCADIYLSLSQNSKLERITEIDFFNAYERLLFGVIAQISNFEFNYDEEYLNKAWMLFWNGIFK
ncbi:TetR/AcrR family transcriptional regulator [Sporosalibacterium faouarense]|uniref:TetR/AcrR family transcriptional regulator n=1 Tax=Sporosalibacterium faouarense TaxID=516123 RepID=UPI00192C8B0F|nr:TetR/AcrR family transcriptional regulator [Sporosalibacterium faouarense]